MLQIFLGLLLGFVFIFLLMYTYDAGIIWPCRIHLRQPSLSDIDLSNQLRAEEYTKHEICPAYHYFILRNELEKPFSESFVAFGAGIYLVLPCALLAASGLRSLDLIQNRLLCVVASAIALCLLGFLARLLYGRLLKIPRYNYTPEDLARDREHLAKFPREYGESLDAALNNYAISMHYQYLLPLRKTVRTRIAFRRVLVFFGVVSYVFFFLPYINY